jgi:arsenate reductase-like glutaredoxin family protein
VREYDVASNYALDLYDASVSDEQLIDAMIKRPILINCPLRADPQGRAGASAGREGGGNSFLNRF